MPPQKCWVITRARHYIYIHRFTYSSSFLTFMPSPAMCLDGPPPGIWTAALAACQAADFIIVADGISNSVEAEEHDRYTIAWPATTVESSSLAVSLGIPVIVFQVGAGQLDDSALLT